MTLLSRASYSLQQEHRQMRLAVSSALPTPSREGREGGECHLPTRNFHGGRERGEEHRQLPLARPNTTEVSQQKKKKKNCWQFPQLIPICYGYVCLHNYITPA